MSELAYYNALKRIAAYASPKKLERDATKEYGLDYTEALEMAYENILAEARAALHGKRKPVEKPKAAKAIRLGKE